MSARPARTDGPRALLRGLLIGLISASAFVPAFASAGGLGDFSSSIDRERHHSRDDSDNDDDDSDDDDDDGYTYGQWNRARRARCSNERATWNGESFERAGYEAGCDPFNFDDVSLAAQMFGWIISGYRPEDRFSYGTTPFSGRRYLNDTGAYVASLSDLSLAGEVVDDVRYGFLRARFDETVLSDASAVGPGFFARVESTYTPGISFSHRSLEDADTGDHLNKTHIALEPHLWIDELATWSYSLGYVHYATQDGPLNGGVLLGAALDAYPLQPIFIEARVQVELMSETNANDLFFGVGTQFAGPFTLEAGYRRMNSPTMHLDMFSMGVGLNLGI